MDHSIICISYGYLKTSVSFLDLLYELGCIWKLERLNQAKAQILRLNNKLHFSVVINPCGLDQSGILIFNHNAVVLKLYCNYIFFYYCDTEVFISMTSVWFKVTLETGVVYIYLKVKFCFSSSSMFV